jgi:predicted transposase/invertase (TIGR01784 family)
MKAKYINPFTDFGFKKLFGEEASKPMLIDFLQSLLPQSNIVDITFKDKEKLGRTEQDRKTIYDIYCESKNGEKIIVELQKAKQNYFKDRTVYYSSFPIQEQAEKGEWNYRLNAVYCIGILDFKFDILVDGEVIHTVQLKNQHNQIFYDKLTFVYLEMPNFKALEQDLVTRLDKWLYFIKHLEDFQSIPEIFKDEVFIQAFEKAEIANYNEEERDAYQQSLKVFRDNKATFDYAIETALSEEKIRTAVKLRQLGIDILVIAQATGLSNDEIERL